MYPDIPYSCNRVFFNCGNTVILFLVNNNLDSSGLLHVVLYVAEQKHITFNVRETLFESVQIDILKKSQGKLKF